MSNCPKCGYPIAPEETACTNCGEPVENTKEENVSPENTEELEKEDKVELEESSDIEDVPDTLEPEDAEDIVDEEESLESKENTEEKVEESVEEKGDSSKEDVSDETALLTEDQQMPIAPEVNVEIPEISQDTSMMSVATNTVEMPEVNSELPGVPQDAPMMPVAPSTVEMPEVNSELLGVSQNVPTMPVAPSTVEIPVVMPQEVPMTPMEVPNMVTPEIPPAPMSPELGMMPPTDNGILMQPAPIPMSDTSSMPIADSPALDLNVETKTSSKTSIFNKVVFFLVFIVSIVAIALLSFFMMKIFSKDNTTPGTNVSETAREYHYEGFNFYIPEKDEKKDDIHAEISNGEFYIGTNAWSAVLTLQTGTYNNLLSNKSQLIDYFKDMGYEPTEPTEKEVSGVSFVKMEVVMGSKNVLVAYAKANGTKLYGIILENETGEYTDDDLKTIGTLLGTAKYVGPKFSLPEGLQLDKFKETFMVAE